MILLADSGSTKTEWCLAENGKRVKTILTKGINPVFENEEAISQELKAGLMPELKGFTIDEVHFFGAGCAYEAVNKIVENAVSSLLDVPVEVQSDLLCAARALFGKGKGIACIMGTGSNSCYYDGMQIVRNVSPLGFILGDEGSGAVLGKLLVGACLKNQLGAGMEKKFLERFHLTRPEIIDRVYRKPFPNRFLAGLSVFLHENIELPEVRSLVREAFDSFFLRNVMQYPDYHMLKVSFTGSIAYYYQDILKEVAAGRGLHVGTIVKAPMEGLLAYYAGL